jgi:hypothetical protein
MWESKLNASRAVNDELVNTSESTGSMRLPVTGNNSNNTATAKETDKTSSVFNSSNSYQNSPNELPELKPNIDDATKAAFHALPQALYTSGGKMLPTGDVNKVNLKKPMAAQLDGAVDGSSSDEDDDDDEIGVGLANDEDEDDDLDEKANEDQSECEGKEDPDPLNSDDDLTDRESTNSNSDLFDTEHVIVCQYDKV